MLQAVQQDRILAEVSQGSEVQMQRHHRNQQRGSLQRVMPGLQQAPQAVGRPQNERVGVPRSRGSPARKGQLCKACVQHVGVDVCCPLEGARAQPCMQAQQSLASIVIAQMGCTESTCLMQLAGIAPPPPPPPLATPERQASLKAQPCMQA